MQTCSRPVTLYLDGETALHIAAAKDYTEVLQVLLRYEADKEVRESVYGRTPLHVAVISDSGSSASCLLQHGATNTTQDSVRDN